MEEGLSGEEVMGGWSGKEANLKVMEEVLEVDGGEVFGDVWMEEEWSWGLGLWWIFVLSVVVFRWVFVFCMGCIFLYLFNFECFERIGRWG